MPTGLPLDFDALLAPLGDAEPAGSSSVYFELRPQLEDLRKEINLEDYAANDPTRPTEAKHADWPHIEELTRTALAKRSKDLRIAGYLLEALVKRYSFPGLREGLKLLREMLEKCWERMYPSIEDGDLDVRAGMFNSLDDDKTHGRLPFTQILRTLPILGPGAGKYGYDDWVTSQDAGQEKLAESVAQAIRTTPPQRGAELAKALDECAKEVKLLAATLETKIGPNTTHLPNLQKALGDCQRVVRLVDVKIADERPAETAESDTSGNGQAAPRAAAATGQSRADVYRQLADAAALLQRLEPHSPIPYLVQRAVELGSLPFPLLMKALIRDANVLTELNRELGITKEE